MNTVARSALARWSEWPGWKEAAIGLGLAVVVSMVASSQPLEITLAFPIGVAGAMVIIRYPFLGLLGLVFGAQLGGLIHLLAPAVSKFALEGIALLTIGGVALNSYREPRSERLGPDMLAVRLSLLFAVVLVISSMTAEYKDLAQTGLRKQINLLVLFLLVVRMIKTTRQMKAIVLAVVASTVLSAGISVFGYVTGAATMEVGGEEAGGESGGRQSGAGAQSATSNAAPLAAGTALAALLALRSTRRRLLWAACAALGAAGVILSFSRSVTLVIAIAVVWLAIKSAKQRHLFVVVVTLLTILTSSIPFIPARHWARFAALTDPGQDFTLSRRVGYQFIGIDLLQSHPILGVGPDNFKMYYQRPEYRFMPGRSLESRALHNMYLSVATETGLLGFACFGGLLFVALRDLGRVRRRARDPDLRTFGEAFEFAFAVYLMTCLFGSYESTKYLWILLGLAVSVAHLAERELWTKPDAAAASKSILDIA